MATLLLKKIKNFDYQKHSQELFDKIDSIKIESRKEIKESGAFIGFIDLAKNEKFMILKAYKEYQRKAEFFDGNPKKLKEINNLNGEDHSILITQTGYILHETSKFFNTGDISGLIMGTFKSIGLHQVSLEEINSFDLKVMRTFFKTAKKVCLLRVREIGEIPPNPRMPSEDIEGALQDIASGSNYVSMISGRDKNLKESQIINDGIARRSAIDEVRGVDEEGDTFTIGSKGKIDVHLSKDLIKKANKMYKILDKIIGVFS